MSNPAPVVEAVWVWRLRWLVSVTHVLVVAFTVVLGQTVDWPVAVGVVLVGLTSNGLLSWMVRGDRALPALATAAVLAFDVVLLTALLMGTGAASSPFTFLYLFQVVTAAMVLEPAGVWGIVVVGALGYGSLFLLAPADPHAHHHGAGSAMDSHFLGMWIAFGISAPFAAFVVTRVRRALADATRRMEEARRLQERTERLTALGTLAAGAAHELATPLSTIAVVAGDLKHHADTNVADDAGVIRAQVEQCRAVLSQLAADSGQRMGQRPRAIRGDALMARILDGQPDRVSGTVHEGAEARLVLIPEDLVAQAIRQLVANALDATGGPVRVQLHPADEGLHATVTDEGPGMTPEVLARATEPFFTTKPEGEGMGLGLHFVRSIAEQVCGTLELTSTPGEGTRATMTLPGCTP